MQCENFRMIQQHIKQARARRRESEIQVEIKSPPPLNMRVVCLGEFERCLPCLRKDEDVGTALVKWISPLGTAL